MLEANTEDDFVISLAALLLRVLARTLVESGSQTLFACHIRFSQTSFYSAEAWKTDWCCLVPGPATESTGWKILPVITKLQSASMTCGDALERVSPARGSGFKAGIISAAEL